MFLLGSLGIRVVWWGLMPLVYVGLLYAVLYYAKEGTGTIMDA